MVYIPKKYQIRSRLKIFPKLLKNFSSWAGIIAGILGLLYAFKNEVDIIRNFINRYNFIFFLVIGLFIILFSVPFFYVVIIIIKFIFHFFRDLYKIKRNYLTVLNLWDKESKKNNIVIIPKLNIPTYKCFTLDFKNESKKLSELSFNINKIISQKDHNWNLKIAFLRNDEDFFYIILHTKMLNETGDKDELHIAIENKNLGDTIQKHEIIKKISAKDLFSFKIQLINCKDTYSREIKIYLNEIEIKVLNRVEKINEKDLHNFHFEIFSSLCFKEPVWVEAVLKDFLIIWEL